MNEDKSTIRLEKIWYTFYIQVLEDGAQRPRINTPFGPYEFLCELANDHLTTSKGVADELIQLNKVVNGEIEQHDVSSCEWCVIVLGKNNSILAHLFDEYGAVEVPTSEVKIFLEGWKAFLEKYESGLIPGLNSRVIKKISDSSNEF